MAETQQYSPERSGMQYEYAGDVYYPHIANDPERPAVPPQTLEESNVLAAAAKEAATPAYTEELPETPEVFEALDPREASAQMRGVATIIEANRADALNPTGTKDDYSLAA